MNKLRYYTTVSVKCGTFEDIWDVEHVLDTRAKKYLGEMTGAGYGFGCRDISFEFKTEQKRRQFLKTFSSKRLRVNGQSLKIGEIFTQEFSDDD